MKSSTCIFVSAVLLSTVAALSDPAIYRSNYGPRYYGRYYSPRRISRVRPGVPIRRPIQHARIPYNYRENAPLTAHHQPAITDPRPIPALRTNLRAVPAVPDNHIHPDVTRNVQIVAKALNPRARVHQEPHIHHQEVPHVHHEVPQVNRVLPTVAHAPASRIIPAAPVGRFVPAVAAPVVSNVIASNVVSSQFHAQDEFGNVNYGYSNPNSAKQEVRDSYGNVKGAYSYVDATGLPKHVSYVADADGFRITSTNNLPVDAPDVAAAKRAHITALGHAHHRAAAAAGVVPIF